MSLVRDFLEVPAPQIQKGMLCGLLDGNNKICGCVTVLNVDFDPDSGEYKASCQKMKDHSYVEAVVSRLYRITLPKSDLTRLMRNFSIKGGKTWNN